MPTALMISPHLDDAVFSCGATIATLVERGWRVVVATAFTKSVHPATGFALECQRDKGLGDDVDYLALRRDEDLRAIASLGAEAIHMDMPEAPLRGYESAAALFGNFVDGDTIDGELTQAVDRLVADLKPDLLAGPSAFGDHVDHRRVLDVLMRTEGEHATAFWRDVPYVVRHPNAALDHRLHLLDEVAVTIDATLAKKIDAAGLYTSQIGFQFGDAAKLADTLTTLAHTEGAGVPVERFHTTPAGLRALQP